MAQRFLSRDINKKHRRLSSCFKSSPSVRCSNPIKSSSPALHSACRTPCLLTKSTSRAFSQIPKSHSPDAHITKKSNVWNCIEQHLCAKRILEAWTLLFWTNAATCAPNDPNNQQASSWTNAATRVANDNDDPNNQQTL